MRSRTSSISPTSPNSIIAFAGAARISAIRGARPQRGSCEDTFCRLIAGGITPDRLHEAVCALQIELVLTAHPTEVARRTLVQKYNRIAAALAMRDRPDLTAPEHEDAGRRAAPRNHDGLGRRARCASSVPRRSTKCAAACIVFEQSLWDALPRYLRSVDRALRASTGRGLPIDAAPIRFGSWIGGDRDGNPNVTPQVTRRACLLSRWTAADLYLKEIDALRDELSLESATAELRERVGDAREPYRELLRTVRARLLATREWVEASLRSDDDLDARTRRVSRFGRAHGGAAPVSSIARRDRASARSPRGG